MATVYLAIQENFQREVALKVMSPVLTESGDFSERFLREARIVSRLVHPHIVTVHDVGIQNDHHYLSMEYIEGQELKERLSSLSGEQILRVLAEVAKALDYAGRKGYVHRDVKPENIMIHNQDGRAILMDFGIARAADSVSTMTRTGTALGTPHYMSPEQARGQPVDGRSDLYSLGVLLHYMLTGKVPYEADSPVAVGIKHVSAKLPILPEGLSCYQFLIEKLMAKNPDDRFQTGSELVTALGTVDGTAIDQWRPRKGFEYLGSHEHTPVRSDQVNLQPNSNSSSFQPVANPVYDNADQLNAGNTFDGSQPRETIHIPKEDLDARRVASSGPPWLGLILLLVIAAAGGSYYSYYKGMLELPDEWEAMLPPELVAPVSKPTADKVSGEVAATQPSRSDAVLEGELTDGPDEGAVETPLADDVAEGVAQPESIESLLIQSRDWLDTIDTRPERITELVALYRQILAIDPQQSEAQDSLALLQQQSLSLIDRQLDDGEIAAAQSSLEEALDWFPELAEDEQYQRLEQRYNQQQRIASLLAKAEDHLARDRLLQPAGDNARETFDQVLALDANNNRALAGLEKVVRRYGVLSMAAYNREEFDRALLLVNSGLTIDSENSRLLTIKNNVSKALQQHQQLGALLNEANTLAQRQQWFGANSAVQKYQRVLAIDENNQQAQQGLAAVLDDFIVDIEGLVAIRDYELAVSRVQSAIASLPGNERLLFMQQQLQSLAPSIRRLAISGSALAAGAEPMARKVKADRTLYIAFDFNNLEPPTTVLQAVLFDGGRSMQIAGVPVVVVGSEGRAQFRIDRPVEGFTEGGYHIDILLAGEQIFSHAFVIENK